MHYVQNLALGLLAAAAVVAADAGQAVLTDDAKFPDVVQLKKDTFEEYIKNNDIVLAEFFAPWCGHCKALLPEFLEAATSLKDKGVKLVQIDCTEEQDLCKIYEVEGYPTLKVFRGLEKISAYKGQRKAAAITSYMIKQSLPAVSTITDDTIADFKKADKVVIIAYIDASDKSSNETFTKVAEKLRDNYPFGASSCAKLAKAEGARLPSILLYKDFDEGKSIFTEKFEADTIEKFIKTAATPLIGEVGPETYSEYMEAGLPLAYIFAETAEERTELSDKLKPVAEAHHGVVNFATIDAKAFGAHAGNLNLKTDKFPAFAIQETVKNQKFPFDQEKTITREDVEAFVRDFVAGKLEPSVKSEPIPETQEGPVIVAVAKSYDSIVLDDTKDVLVEYYAPWCGHCKALAPKYEQLASLYANSDFKDKVVIAKLDATANDVSDDIQGFPTIKMYPAGAKDKPETFSGARTVADLVKFIAESGKYKASVPVEEETTAEEAPSAAPAAAESVTESGSAADSKDAEPDDEDSEASEVHDEL